MGALPNGKTVQRHVVKRLWINGCTSEDTEEWKEEVKAHCERCHDDKDWTSKKQEERIQVHEAWTGRKG